ncbi:MAG: metal-dependent hydrolase [Prevotellaceae bacterium]|jgi:inner membrane protein|nr:metal-dependent hydrolase [Prevotellaceae bacterium]
MDTISHALIGAVTGEIVAGGKLGKKAVLWGTAIANLPDLDVIAQPFLKPAQSLLFHRGPSHSILFCVLIIPLIVKLMTIIHKKTKKNRIDWIRLVSWCLFSHIFIDCFNSYGTAIFYPFSNFRVAFDCMGIVDVLLIFPFAVALLLFIFIKRTGLRKTVALLSMLLSILYLGFAVVNKINLEQKIKSHLAGMSINYDRILTSPLPLTNFVWIVIVEDEDGFFSTNYNVVNRQIKYEKYFPKNHYLSEKFNKNAEFMRLVRFSKGFYCLSRGEDDEIIFYDLRFASFDFDGVADLDKAVFVHRLKMNENGELTMKHRYPERKVSFEKLKRYCQQILNTETQDRFNQ